MEIKGLYRVTGHYVVERVLGGYRPEYFECDNPADVQWDRHIAKLSFDFHTALDAAAFADRFPKYCKMSPTKLWSRDGEMRWTVGSNLWEATRRTKTTGDRNEAGIKRRDKILEISMNLAA